MAQHAQYEAALTRLGCRVERLPDAPELPDSVFVEDAAVVFDDLAVIARPGAASRRPEVDAMAAALRPHRPLAFIEAPGTLDGGDVLVTPGKVFVGISGRTNDDGVRQLARVRRAARLRGGRGSRDRVSASEVGGDAAFFRLKAEAHAIAEGGSGGEKADDRLLINPAWIDASVLRRVRSDRGRSVGAGGGQRAARSATSVICAAEHPKTRARLEARGLVTHPVPAGELAKAEGGVTCCSIILSIT